MFKESVLESKMKFSLCWQGKGFSIFAQNSFISFAKLGLGSVPQQDALYVHRRILLLFFEVYFLKDAASSIALWSGNWFVKAELSALLIL